MTGGLKDQLDALQAMGTEELREVWRPRLGEPPPLRSADLLRRALAERLQLEAFGRDLDLERELGRLARRHRAGWRSEGPKTSYRAGSQLSRAWGGVRHTVEVVEGGYIWNGARHDSLSRIAREITGVRWNGPRFFGLREGDQ